MYVSMGVSACDYGYEYVCVYACDYVSHHDITLQHEAVTAILLQHECGHALDIVPCEQVNVMYACVICTCMSWYDLHVWMCVCRYCIDLRVWMWVWRMYVCGCENEV